MEKHDHPTARQRLGDLEAGLGSAATLTSADAEAIRRCCAACSTSPAACTRTCAFISATSAGSRACTAPTSSCRRSGAPGRSPDGRFFTRARADERRAGDRLGQVVADKLFGAGANAVGQEVMMWNQPFEVVGVVDERELGGAARAGRRSVRRGLHAVHDHAPAAEPVEAERHHHHRRVVRRGVAAVARHHRSCCGSATASATTKPDDFTVLDAGHQGADDRRPAAERGARRGRQRRRAGEGHARAARRPRWSGRAGR